MVMPRRDPRDPADYYRDKDGNTWTMMALGAWADGDDRYAEYANLRNGHSIVTTTGAIRRMIEDGEWVDATPPMPPCNGPTYGHDEPCEGEVEWQFTGIGMKTAPLCPLHHKVVLDANLKLMERVNEYHSPSPPDWYDYLNAGEHWSEDDY